MATLNNNFSDPFSFAANAAELYEPLLNVATAVATSTNPNDLLDRVAQKFTQLFHVSHCYIRTWQPETGHYAVLADAGPNRKTAVFPDFPYPFYQKIAKEHKKLVSKTPVVLQANDPLLAESERAHLAQHGGQTVLILPLKAYQQIVGFVELWETRQPRQFSQSELAQCMLMGQHTAVALLQLRLQEKEFQARRESETLLDIAKYLAETLDLSEIFERTLTIVRRYLGPISNCSIALLSDDGRELQTRAQWSERPEHTITYVGESLPLDDLAISKLTLRNRHPMVISDTEQISLLNLRILALREKGLRAALYIPLLTRGKPVGLLNIHIWHTARQFSPQEVSLCQNIGYHVAMAIENTLFHDAQNRQLKLAGLLQKMGHLLTTRFTAEQLYQQLFDCLAEVAPYDFAYLQLQHKHTAVKQIVASRGLLQREKPTFYDDAIEADLQLERPLQSQGWAIADPSLLKTAIPPFPQAQSWLAVAIKSKDQFIGVLNVASKQAEMYDVQTAQATVGLANQTAVAIANGRLHEQVVEQADEMAILHQISATTLLNFDVDALLNRTTQMLVRRLYSSLFGFVMRHHQDGQLWPHPSFHGADAAWLAQAIPPESIVGQAAASKRTQIISDAETATAVPLASATTQSAIAVPLIISDELIGVLLAESPHENAFSNKDLYFLTTLARQLAVVIERAQSYQALLAQKESLKGQVGQRAAELQAEQERTIAILESAGEGIVLTDAQLTILYVNRAMELMSGYGRDELLGQPVHCLLAERSREPLAQKIALADGRAHWSDELLNQRKDGSTYDVRLTVTPIANRANQTNGYVIIQSDISRLKEVERLKIEFTSNVTHDLRTPLTNIKTYVSLLERGKPENYGRYFSVLHQEIDRLNQLIQNLLDISRLDVELLPDASARTDLVAELQALQHTFAPLASHQNVRQRLTLPTVPIPLLPMSKLHLRKLLENLLDNAIKYSLPETEVTVQVQIDGRFVQIDVTDQGVGIPLAEQPRLFERFFRGEAARAAHIAGLGLGLTMAQKIAACYGGHIHLQSQAGVGSQFSLRLPWQEADEPISS